MYGIHMVARGCARVASMLQHYSSSTSGVNIFIITTLEKLKAHHVKLSLLRVASLLRMVHKMLYNRH